MAVRTNTADLEDKRLAVGMVSDRKAFEAIPVADVEGAALALDDALGLQAAQHAGHRLAGGAGSSPARVAWVGSG